MSQDNIIFKSIDTLYALMPTLTTVDQDLKEYLLDDTSKTRSSLNTFLEGMRNIFPMLFQGAAQLYNLQTKQIEELRTETSSALENLNEKVDVGFADTEYNIIEELKKTIGTLKANEDYKAKIQKICTTKSKLLANMIIDMARAQNINLSTSVCKVDTVAKILQYVPAALEEFD